MKTFLFVLYAGAACSQVIPNSLIRDILSEVSSESALEHTRALAGIVRYPNSESFFEAAEHVATTARRLGLQNVRVERFAADQPMWDPLEGELDLVEPEARRIASFRDTPVLIAVRSRDGEMAAAIVDVGEGTSESDYVAKEIRGKILLAGGPPDRVWQVMGERGAVGLLSVASGNFFGRQTAPDAVLWGEAPPSTLAMMISPDQGRQLRNMLRSGKTVKIRMRVQTRLSERGEIGMVVGEIPGSVKDQDIVLVSHLDHQKPGANDNASGSGTLLEVLATTQRLVAVGKLPPPRRTLRFWWSTEIRSERAYFKKYPEEARKILLAVNLDQAGGDRNAENNFVMIGGPAWLATYADDLLHSLAEHMKNEYAPAEHEPSPLFVAPNGSRGSFRPVYWDYAPLSDHIALEAKAVGIPCLSMAVPSLDVIHTNQDTIDRIDPTWLKRSALMMLAPALWAASAGGPEARALLDYVFRRARVRIAESDDPVRQAETEEKRLDSVRVFDGELSTESHKNKLRRMAEAMAGQ